jgi:hypothetical protein
LLEPIITVASSSPYKLGWSNAISISFIPLVIFSKTSIFLSGKNTNDGAKKLK